MTPALDLRLVPWLCAVVLATLAPHAEHLPAWLSAFSATCIGLCLWRWHQGNLAIPRLLLVLLVIAGSAGIVVQFRTIFGQEPGVALLALLTALKLLEMRTSRDAFVIVMLGYFLLLTHYFNAESMAVGSWMLIALILVTTAQIRIQAPAADIAGSARLAGVLVAQSLPIMFILFLLFPRISGPLWGLPQDTRKASTGLSDQMSPGSISELSQSAAIAFRVQFAGNPPDRQSLYWRGPVMSDYDGRVWRPTRAGIGNPPDIDARTPALDYTITLEAHQQRWLLALDLPVKTPAGTAFTPGLSLVRRDTVRERLRYDAASVTGYTVNLKERPDVIRQSLALPRGLNPRARELAETWRRDIASPEMIAARALALFREQAFLYTLQPPLLGEHAIDDFLFSARRGFCEHYAAAFVFLMRAAGIPARVIGGYQGGEANPVDGYMVVRQSDAHAWSEVWFENRGWVRIDPTAVIAPSRVEQGIAAALPAGEPLPAVVRGGLDWVRTLRYRWEALNNVWNQWVLGYDAEQQRRLLSKLGFGTDWRQLIASLTVIAGVALLVITFWVLRSRPPADPALRLWRDFCRRMARQGMQRQPWEGPQDFAARIAATAPEFAAASGRVAAIYIRLRYGRAGDDDLVAMRAALREIPRVSLTRRHRATVTGNLTPGPSA